MLHTRPAARVLFPVVALTLAGGCVTYEELPAAPSQSQGIAGGELAPEDPAIVGLLTGHSACSGTLIAPNLVLTAHHCVAQTPPGPVSCDETAFGPLHDNVMSVTTHDSVLGIARHIVREVHVPPGSEDLCGGDVAVMILDDVVEPTEAWPIPPRVDRSPSRDETYRAVGFGAIDGDGTGSGLRRQRGGLRVDCVGDGCLAVYEVQLNEWMGETGVCAGDSGGPALDEQGRVMGVTSRGGDGCTTPIYGDVAAWRSWLMQMGERAAELGGYEPHPWVRGGSTMPNAVPEPPPEAGAELAPRIPLSASGGCHLAAPLRSRFGHNALIALSLAVGAAAARRRGGHVR